MSKRVLFCLSFFAWPIFGAAATFHGVPMSCVQSAASRYGLSADVVLAILRTEGGRPGTVAPDPNGTDDLGPAQVNTCHLPFLSRYGYTRSTLINNPCANVMAGAWIFARCLAGTPNLPQAAACYNAGSHPWLAWQSGYVQRFSRYLGLPAVITSKPKAFLFVSSGAAG
ncbi:lytic transglycosylase domain-containing protein [Acidithiobacillus ferrivorans]|nr:lytic transglycosylase domain-containing protein [Acidithiobacillus ferrivorans]